VALAGEPDAGRAQERRGRVGAREPGGAVVPAHAPRFYAAEESIFVGAAVLAEAARLASTV
jgi:hypothetical protein